MGLTLRTVGESSESVFEQLTAIHGCLQSSSQLEDVFEGPAQTFFRQLHAVFSRSRTEQNHKCLNLLMEVIQECCYVANRKQKYNSVSPLLTDILMCLLSTEAYQSAESLLTYINTECDIELRNELKEEVDRILLNSKDQKLVQAVKAVPGLVSNSPKGGSINSPKGSRNAAGGSTGGSTPTRDGAAGGTSTSTSTGSSSRSGGGIMKLSFLPHSITEQWLLASGVDELRFVLEEVTAVYSSLSSTTRENCKADMPIALKQVMTNITAESHSSVVINGLKFMEKVSDYNVEAFLDDRNLVEMLFPKLSKCLESSKEDLRKGSMRLAVSLVAQLPYHITDKFILQCVENESKYPGMALKLACVALIAAGREMSGETRKNAMSSTLPLRLARVAKAAVLVLNDYEREETKAKEKAGKDASVPISLIQCNDIAKDAVAAALLVLCPHESNESTGIFPEFLPNSFVDRLLSCTEGPPRRPTPLSAAIQAEITLRASGLSFPSLVTDPIVSSHVQAILNSKVASYGAGSPLAAPASSGGGGKSPYGARKRKDSDYGSSDKAAAGGEDSRGRGGMTPEKEKSSTWPGSPSPTSRRLSPSSAREGSTMPSVLEGGNLAVVDGDEHRSLKYQPSWGSMEHAEGDHGHASPLDRAFHGPGGVPSSPVLGGEEGVDRSKLHHLKNSRRKPGSRRAHSAEIGSIRDMEATSLREAPSTSDGYRVANAAAAGGATGTEPPVQYLSVGNYTGQDGGHKTMKLGAATVAGVDKEEKKKKRTARGSLTELLDTSEYIVGDYANNRIIPEQDDLETSFGGSGLRDLDLGMGMKASAGGGGAKKSPLVIGADGGGGGGRGHAETMSRLESARTEREQAEKNLLSMFNEYDVSNPSATGAGGGSGGQEPKKYAYFAGSEMAAGGGSPGAGGAAGATAGGAASASASAKKKGKKSLRRRSDDRDRDRSGSPRRDRDPGEFGVGGPGGANGESKREAPSALKPESLDYLDTDEITPCKDPRADLSKATSALLTDDWLDIFHALNVVRQLALHHQALLLNSSKDGKGAAGGPPIGSPVGARSPSMSGKNQAPALRALASAVLKQVDNLRSQVAKNAIVTIGDMFIGLKSKMDPEVPALVPVLIKKCADQATKLLSESAESTLCLLIDHASPARTLNAFVSASDNRNPTLRGKVAGFLGFLISQKADELRGLGREIETLKTRLKTLINDNTPEARASSRDIVRIMLETRLSTRSELELLIPPETIDKALRSAPNMHLSPKRSASVKKGSTSPKKSGSGLGGFKSPPRGGASSSYMDSGDEGLELDMSRFNITAAQGGLLSDDDDDDDDIESSGGGGFVLSPIKKKSASRSGGTSFSSSSYKKGGAVGAGTGGSGSGSNISADMGNIPSGMGTPSRAKAMAAKRQLDNNEELRALPDLLANGARSASWKERMDTTALVSSLMCQHMICLRDSSQLEPCLEFVLAGLEDGSVKVNIQSLQSLHKIHVEVPALLPNLQLTVLPALLKAASSGNRSVSSSAQPILRDILSSFPVQHVVTQLCHMSLYEADRLRVMALRVLSEQVSKVCGTGNPATNSSVRNTIFPTIKTILLGSGASAAKGDVRIGCADVLKEIQRACPMGEHIHTWVDDKTDQDAIKKCVSTKG